MTQDDYYRGDFFLRVVGDSMSGAHIHDGDLLYVKNVMMYQVGQLRSY